MPRKQQPGKMKRERHNRGFMDAAREDMAVPGMTEEDAEDAIEWR